MGLLYTKLKTSKNGIDRSSNNKLDASTASTYKYSRKQSNKMNYNNLVIVDEITRQQDLKLNMQSEFNKLTLFEDDIKIFEEAFKKMDTLQCGCIDPLLFESALHLNNVNFISKLFENFDQSGIIDFVSFVFICWEYATLDSERLGK